MLKKPVKLAVFIIIDECVSSVFRFFLLRIRCVCVDYHRMPQKLYNVCRFFMTN